MRTPHLAGLGVRVVDIIEIVGLGCYMLCYADVVSDVISLWQFWKRGQLWCLGLTRVRDLHV